jgi:hypothetical protein
MRCLSLLFLTGAAQGFLALQLLLGLMGLVILAMRLLLRAVFLAAAPAATAPVAVAPAATMLITFTRSALTVGTRLVLGLHLHGR